MTVEHSDATDVHERRLLANQAVVCLRPLLVFGGAEETL